jgi:antitoxin MazE
MQTALKRIGNSAGVIIPKPYLAELGINAGDPVELFGRGRRHRHQGNPRHVRAGWAEAAAALAGEPEDAALAEWDAIDADEDGDWRW